MAAIIGGVVGGLGSLFGGKKASQAADQGFDYAKSSKLGNTYLPNGGTANANINALLNGGPNSAAAKSAYANYLSSTGYDFQMQQGEQAITGSAAARGILNSGSTAKALTSYGQSLASTSFNNYLGQEDTLANQGLQAGQIIAQAGTQGGATAAQAQAGGIAGLAGSITGLANNGAFANIFGGI